MKFILKKTDLCNRPWRDPRCIAGAPEIKKYLQEAIEASFTVLVLGNENLTNLLMEQDTGLDKKIQYRHSVTEADWSSGSSTWELKVDASGTPKRITSRFVIMASGYYDYHNPLKADIPGIESFQGQTIHPQFWPEDFDCDGKKVVIIGSGATSVTLLPNLAKIADHITMLQRSPSYVMALPAVDPFGAWAKKWLPEKLSFSLVRLKFLILPFLFFKFCRAFPNAARFVMRKSTEQQLQGAIPHDPHFKPRYGPWEQRLCVCPDGDFFKALERDNADVVTDSIKTVTETGIETSNGTFIPADIIITATGLKIQIGGGAKIKVDGKPFTVSDHYLWKGVMLSDLPNMATVIGYTNASWTLGADATALHLIRLIKYMKEKNYVTATPRVKDAENIGEQPVLNLNSSYVERAKGELPKAGLVAPWKPRETYFSDMYEAKYGNLGKGLEFRSAKN